MKKTLKTIASAATLLAACSAFSAEPQQNMAMKCYVTYDLLIDANKTDDLGKYQNQILGSQALFMASVYVAYQQKGSPKSKAYLLNLFKQSSMIARDAILNAALEDSDTLKEQLLICENWRERSIISMSQKSATLPGTQQPSTTGYDALTSLPDPSAISVSPNSGSLELSMFIDETINRIRKNLEEGLPIVGNALVGEGTNAIEDGYVKDKLE